MLNAFTNWAFITSELSSTELKHD
jgi:hypothetical protein